VANVDHGRKRFLLFQPSAAATTCSTPALAWLESPAPGAVVGDSLELSGWALKEGVGLDRVEVTVDGRAVGDAELVPLGPDVLAYWGVADGADGAGFRARIDLSGQHDGDTWLGLVLHGRDGSVEAWPEQRLTVDTQGRR